MFEQASVKFLASQLTVSRKTECKQDLTRQAVYVQLNIRARSRKHSCRRKAICIKYSECVSVASVIQHAQRMRRTTSFVACLVVPYFSTLTHKRHAFREEVIKNKICVLSFSTTSI